MGNPYPSHTCTVSPFESYHSNVVNRLNRLVSNNEDCIFSSDKINATITSGSEVTLSSGSVFKDDVFITIEDFIVDFSDADYYYYGTIWDEIGYYYILLYYVYEKTRPAPKPRIQILKPSERTTYVPDGDFVLIKVAKVECVTTFQVTQLLDFDPDNPTVRRIYSKTYIGLEDEKPVFDVNHDPGRLLLTTDDDILQYGGSVDWITIPSMALIDAQFVNLRAFVGSVSPSDTTPDYSSIRHIVQDSNLKTAISTLDLSVGYSDLKKTINDNSATPSILSTAGKICGFLYIANTVATTITDLTGAPSVGDNECVVIVLKFANSNTIVQHNANINLIDVANFSGAAGDTLALVRHIGVWNEIFRGVVAESTLFHVDHDALGHHKLGGWHIGVGLVPASVTAANLTKLTDGTTLNFNELHNHKLKFANGWWDGEQFVDFSTGIITKTNYGGCWGLWSWGGSSQYNGDLFTDASKIWVFWSIMCENDSGFDGGTSDQSNMGTKVGNVAAVSEELAFSGSLQYAGGVLTSTNAYSSIYFIGRIAFFAIGW